MSKNALLNTRMENQSKRMINISIIILVCSFILVFLILPDSQFNEPYKARFELFLTIAIAFFAMMEGVSSYLNIANTSLRLKAEDLRNELEKAHGILYTIVEDMYHVPGGGGAEDMYCFKNPGDKEKVDEIFRKYPFMFDQPLKEIWMNEIERLEPIELEGCELYEVTEIVYDEFQSLVLEEYFNKIAEYQKLIGIKKNRHQKVD